MSAPPLADATERAVHERLERASLYRLLGSAFAYPAPGDLPALACLARALVETAPSGLAGPLARLAATAGETECADVAAEYVFLFDRGARCPPYEGAWEEAPQLAGKAALLADVAGFYRAFGLEPASAQPDAEDHIAAECEFMSALAVKEAWAMAEANGEAALVTRAAQRSFLSDHLGRWADAFAGTLREATPLAFYAALADVLSAWVAADVAALDATPVRLSGRPCQDPIQAEDAFTCPMAPETPSSDEGEAAR